jgi:hypothetical protein
MLPRTVLELHVLIFQEILPDHSYRDSFPSPPCELIIQPGYQRGVRAG